MTPTFDPKAAARKSAESAAAREQSEAAASLRDRIRGRKFDWDAEFTRRHNATFAKQPEPYSTLNKYSPFESLIGAMRCAHAASAFHNQRNVMVWVEAMVGPLGGLRAELLAIAAKIEVSHPMDAELLRRLVTSERPPLLTDEELDYECGRRDINTAKKTEIPDLLADTHASSARLLGRRDQAQEKG